MKRRNQAYLDNLQHFFCDFHSINPARPGFVNPAPLLTDLTSLLRAIFLVRLRFDVRRVEDQDVDGSFESRKESAGEIREDG